MLARVSTRDYRHRHGGAHTTGHRPGHRTLHPGPAPQRRGVAAPVGRSGRRQQPVPLPDRARPAQAQRGGATADRGRPARLHPRDVPAGRTAGRQGPGGRVGRDRRRSGPHHRSEAVAEPDLRDLPTGEHPRQGGRGTRPGGTAPRGTDRGGIEVSKKTELRTRTELPDAFYAAAGVGDLAYQRLRKLPETTARTLRTASQTAGALRERLINRERELTAELGQMRATARRRAESLAARAAKAQEKAVARYRSLVAHGEQIVN